MYTVTEIAELIEYHLVASARDDERADDSLAQLVVHIQRLSSRSIWHETVWMFCDSCGCSVAHGPHPSRWATPPLR